MNYLINTLPATPFHYTLKLQLARSATSVALNYDEALGAALMKDFIHKLSIVLKELKETKICLNLLLKSTRSDLGERIQNLYNEADESASIIYSSIRTSKNKLGK